MKWKVLFKSLFYSLFIVSVFLTFIEYSLGFLGYNTFSIDVMAEIFPPLIFLVKSHIHCDDHNFVSINASVIVKRVSRG